MPSNNDAIKRLLSKIIRLSDKQRQSRSEEAPDFNLFRILGVESDEVHTHSAFLAHLLNPNQTHAQGDLFLKEFLSQIGLKSEMQSRDWTVSTEVLIANGRLDILIQSRSLKTLIVVENKIETTDHDEQLDTYRKWLDQPARAKAFSERYLVYLTPHGERSKKAADTCDYLALAYDPGISEILLRSRNAIKSAKVRENIDSYRQALTNICKPDKIYMNTSDRELIKSIETEEEKIAVLAIARIAKPFQDVLIDDFWAKASSFLSERINRCNGKWEMKEYSGGNEGERGVYLVLSGMHPGRPHPRFAFFQFSSKSLFRWELAVSFHSDASETQRERIRALPEAKALVDIMEHKHGMPKKHGWDCYQLLNKDCEHDIFQTLEREIESRVYSTSLFEEGWKLFESIEPQLAKLSKRVAEIFPH